MDEIVRATPLATASLLKSVRVAQHPQSIITSIPERRRRSGFGHSIRRNGSAWPCTSSRRHRV